jgi:hypothetical protein
MNGKKNPELMVIGLAMLAVLGIFLLTPLRQAIQRRSQQPQQPNGPTNGFYIVKQPMSVESLKGELNQRIERYRRGDRQALPFLTGGTNISLVSVRESGNTNMRSASAVLLVDGHRQHLEIPLNVFPLMFVETLPPPPSVADMRQHVEQEAQRLLRGEKSELRLPNHIWTNIVIESFDVASNYTTSWPHRARAVLLSQGLDGNTGKPIEHRSALLVNCMDEDDWALWYQPIRPVEKEEAEKNSPR